MFNENFDALAGNNQEDYLRHFGFTVEDLSFLISPQSSLSPIKKKQRNVFNFDGYQDDTSQPNSAREPPAPGTYGNYPAVYDPSEQYVKEEPLPDSMALPSFEGLDLECFEEGNQGYAAQGPSTYSTAATAGSGASTINTEQPPGNEDLRANFARMGSSNVNMGSLAFSTMSSFNFDEAEADELARGMQGSGSVSNILNMNLGDNGQPNSSVGIGMFPYMNAGNRPYTQHNIPMLPTLAQMSSGIQPTMMCMEDASFIITAQQAQLQQQLQLLEQQQRALANSQWHQQNDNPHSDNTGSGLHSRIGSFKSHLPPLSVDLNALNAAHNAHHQAKLLHAQHGGSGSGVNTNNSSAYSLVFPASTASSNQSSSETSSPERHSYSYDAGSHHPGIKKGSHDERRGSEGSLGATAAAALALASAAGKEKDKGDKDEASRASKSLATISRRFVEHFGDADTFDYISGHLHVNDVHDGPAVTNRVDGAAEVLGVHVRRIYELIKILEILSLVTFTGDKRGKFSWRGTKDFLMTLGAIQADGIVKYPDIAYAHGVCQASSHTSHRGAQDSPTLSSITALYATSPLTSAEHTPVHAVQYSPSSCDFPLHPTAGSRQHQDMHLGGIAGFGSSSTDAFEKNSLSGGNYITNVHASDCIDMNLENIDFAHSPRDIERSELDGTEMDAFVQLMGADSLLESAPGAQNESNGGGGAPKYSKKRTAVKKTSKTPAAAASGAAASTENHEEFMVEGICKSFLQLFLVGMDGLSMNFAIQRLVPMEANQTLSEYNKLNATKIRRVYDVANVLCSLSLINKVVSQKSKSKSEVGTPESAARKEMSTPLRDLHRMTLEAGNSSGGPRGAKENTKADAKVLEWGSFAPGVIRDYYLSKSH